MKKIGFLDYYIDEWHANNYPAMIRASSFKEQFEVAMAWEAQPVAGKKPIDDWCREQKVLKAPDLATVVRECDCLVVLSPDNAEQHEVLADLPLRSGKPVYIDKPIAPSLAAAQRLFAKAHKHGTPMMSCSALRYGSAFEQALAERAADKPVHFAATGGPGVFEIYAIHQLEMLVMALGTGASRVMQCGNRDARVMIIDYPDGRRGLFNQNSVQPFEISMQFGEGKGVSVTKMDDFFPRFIEAMLRFFDTGHPSAPEAETLEIAALIETGRKALESPDRWVSIVR
ncbi:MAG: Gfo/Idh/MocA family oxidoreductase [bacterium]